MHPPSPKLSTPKRKLCQDFENPSPRKIPRMYNPRKITTPSKKLPQNKPTKSTTTKKNPHPQFGQNVFIKIEDQLTLIKHIGLRKSTRSKKKLPPPLPKSITLEVPKITQPPQEIHENAPHPRRKSKNFEESLGIFRNLEHPPNLPHPPPPPRSRHPRPSPSPSRPVTTPPSTSWPAETEHQVDLHCHMKKSVATRAKSKPFAPRQQAVCSDQGPHPPPPQTNFKIETFPAPSLASTGGALTGT